MDGWAVAILHWWYKCCRLWIHALHEISWDLDFHSNNLFLSGEGCYLMGLKLGTFGIQWVSLPCCQGCKSFQTEMLIDHGKLFSWAWNCSDCSLFWGQIICNPLYSTFQTDSTFFFNRVLMFVFSEPVKRLSLCIYWVCVIYVSVLRFYNISRSSKIERILLRKYYHLMAVLMFLPAVIFQVFWD